MENHTSPIGAVELLRKLDPDEIRREIERLDRERDALFVLLRAAMRKPHQRPAAGARDAR